jgi:hypothetical protein
MKKILAAVMFLATTGTVLAQGYYGRPGYAQRQEESGSTPVASPGVRHMLEFSPQTMEAAVLSFDRIKTKGGDADTGANLVFDMNYAYGVSRFLQAGVRFHYLSGLSGAEQSEAMNVQVGGIFNLTTDFTQSAYASLFVGAGWQQKFGTGGTRDDLRLATLAVGKRFPLTMFGIKHVVYSPEVALAMVNSTNDESIDYSQSLEFRLLQFSVFF